jgi:hypothetical protein
MLNSMRTMILLAICCCAGTSAFAQSAQAQDKKPYTCISGMPMWNDIGPESRGEKYKAATKDCQAQYKAERAAADKFFRDSEKQYQESKARMAKLEKELAASIRQDCELRDTYRPDGTDDPRCESIAPRLEVLQATHKSCGLLAGQARPEFCDRLLPLSMGKKYAPIKKTSVPTKPGGPAPRP